MKLPVDACLEIMQYMIDEYNKTTDENVTFKNLDATISFGVTMPDGLSLKVIISKEDKDNAKEGTDTDGGDE